MGMSTSSSLANGLYYCEREVGGCCYEKCSSTTNECYNKCFKGYDSTESNYTMC